MIWLWTAIIWLACLAIFLEVVMGAVELSWHD
jgi:hypothetical protein